MFAAGTGNAAADDGAEGLTGIEALGEDRAVGKAEGATESPRTNVLTVPKHGVLVNEIRSCLHETFNASPVR
jgi:hypothetical protein